MQEAFALTGVRSKKELVHLALNELIRVRKKKSLFDLSGKIKFRRGYNHKALREMSRGPG
jgi:Arc/MetJ family transcription regulator